MQWRLLVLLAGIQATENAPTTSNSVFYDDFIREQIIGSWIVPEDSSDFIPLVASMREEFYDDGTYALYVYRDAACTELDEVESAGWTVKDGVLTSLYKDGSSDHDKIVEINRKSMTLLSLDDGTKYTRKRADTCAR